MDVEAEREHLLEQIRQHAEPEYQKGSSMVMRTQLVVYGVRVPRLREIARAWQRAHKDVTSEELIALVEALWNGRSQEERALAIELLARYPRRIPKLAWSHFDRWRRLVDHWGLTDALGTRLLAPWLLADPDARLDHLRELIADEDVWSRRLALVATVPINRGHTGLTLPDLTLRLVDRVKAERHPMIIKAVSWALREMTKTHRDRVLTYLEENREVLAPLVVREVSNKLRTGLKSGKAANML
ncbi:MAG TPA: DNA alkylation repair protein [Anaerolineales bacterium]|nr:DNA alkylation repair protein [Anaerolineales bacterium]